MYEDKMKNRVNYLAKEEQKFLKKIVKTRDEADKRNQRNSPYRYGDYHVSNMSDQSVILQTCPDRRENGATI